MVEFPKISIKIKNFKLFYKAKTASRLKEIIRKDLERFWASRNDALQMFDLTATRNRFAGKFIS